MFMEINHGKKGNYKVQRMHFMIVKACDNCLQITRRFWLIQVIRITTWICNIATFMNGIYLRIRTNAQRHWIRKIEKKLSH